MGTKFTQTYGWPYPDVNEPPEVQNQLRDALEAVEATLVGVESTIAGLGTRVTDVEAGLGAARWRHINAGTEGAGDFTITVPSGYERLRLTLIGAMDDNGFVQLRINGDTNNRHRFGHFAIDDLTPLFEDVEHQAGVNHFVLSQWGSVESNPLIVDIFPADGAQNPSVLATGGRISDTAGVMKRSFTIGKYTLDAIVSSLVIIDATANFTEVRWWLEGYLA